MLRIDIEKLENHIDRLKATLKKSLLGASIWDAQSGLEIVSYNPKPKAAAELTLFTQSLKDTLVDIGFHPLNRYFLMDLAGDHMVVVILHDDDLMEGMLLDASKVNMGVLFSIAIPYALEDIREAREQGETATLVEDTTDNDVAATTDSAPAQPMSTIDTEQLKLVDKKLSIRRESDDSSGDSTIGAESQPIADNVRHVAFGKMPTNTDSISDEAIARLIEETEAVAEEVAKAEEKPVLSLLTNPSSDELAEAEQDTDQPVSESVETDDYIEEIFDNDDQVIINTTPETPVIETPDEPEIAAESDASDIPPQVREVPTVLELPTTSEPETAILDDELDKLSEDDELSSIDDDALDALDDAELVDEVDELVVGDLAEGSDVLVEDSDSDDLSADQAVDDLSAAPEEMQEDTVKETIEVKASQESAEAKTAENTTFIADADIDDIDKVTDELGLDFDEDEDVIFNEAAAEPEVVLDEAAESVADNVEPVVDAAEAVSTEAVAAAADEPEAPSEGGKYLAEAREFAAHADDQRTPLNFDDQQYFKLYKWPNVSSYDDKFDLSVMCSKLMRRYYDLPTIISWGVSEAHAKEVLQSTYQDGALSVVDELPQATPQSAEVNTAKDQTAASEGGASAPKTAEEKAKLAKLLKKRHKEKQKQLKKEREAVETEAKTASGTATPAESATPKPPEKTPPAAAKPLEKSTTPPAAPAAESQPKPAAEEKAAEDEPEITMFIVDDEELSQQA